MLALEALSQLLEALDRFLAEAARIDKKRAIAAAQVKLERFMSGIFSRQGKAVLTANAKYKSAYPLEESLRPEDMERIIKAIEGAEKEMAAGLVDMTGPLMEAAAQALLASMPEDAAGIAFDLSNPEAVKWLNAHAAEMVTKIDETTMTQMRGLLAQSVDEGWSYNRTAKAIKERFDGFAGKLPQAHIQSRAHLVAVTESRNAYEEANLRTARSLQDAGLPMEKKWMDSGDSKVSAGCRENSSAGWIDLDKSFPSGDERSPRFPGCRCDTLIQMKEEGEEK